MKKLTRVLCVVLAVLMAAAMFAGCKKSANNATSSTINVTSVAPAKVEIVKENEYTIADGSTLVTVITDNTTGTTTMKVAANTTLEKFLEVVTPAEGYVIKMLKADGTEVTDKAAVIEKDWTFEVWKDGEAAAAVSHKIEVVSEEELASAVQEAKDEAARVESETKIQEQQLEEIASQTGKTVEDLKSEIKNNSSTITGPVIGGESQGGIGDNSDVTKKTSSSSGEAYDFVFRTHVIINGDGVTETYEREMLQDQAASLNYSIDIAQDADLANDIGAVATKIAAGKYADLMMTQCGSALVLAKQGCLENLDGTFDLTASYNSVGVVDTLSFNTGKFGVCPSGSAAQPMGVTFNKDMVQKYWVNQGHDDIYTMYKNRTWTSDQYMEIMKACTMDTDGNQSIDQYGMTSNTNVIGIALSSFSGGTAAKDGNGYIYPTFIYDAGIASLNWCREAKANGYWKYIADIWTAIDNFAAGSCASVCTYMFAVSYAADSADFSIGFVPFPIGIGGNQSDYVSQTYNSPCYCVPKNGNIKAAAKVYAGYSKINDKCIDYKLQQYSNAGLDDTGCSVFRWCCTNMTADYSGVVSWGTCSTAIDTSCLNNKDVAAEMNKIKDKAISACNDFYGTLTGQS